MCSQWPNLGQLNIKTDHNNNTLNSIAKIRLHSPGMLSCFSCVQLFSTLWIQGKNSKPQSDRKRNPEDDKETIVREPEK